MGTVIKNTQLIRQINHKSGKILQVLYATETEAWKRTYLDEKKKEEFVKAVEKADLPEGATKAIMAETNHPSDEDPVDHFTTVYQKENNEHVVTKHTYPVKN